MPLPQLELVREYTHPGGAALVEANLKSLAPGHKVMLLSNTTSVKERIGIWPYHHWLARIDRDAQETGRDPVFEQQVYDAVHSTDYDLVIISDYSKHTLNEPLARMITEECAHGRYAKPLFVDARHWDWYDGAYCCFPNAREHGAIFGTDGPQFKNYIQKAGAQGCLVNAVHIPAAKLSGFESPAFDTCGAGDVFLAAFVAQFVHNFDNLDAIWSLAGGAARLADIGYPDILETCARYANRAAAASVRHWGTCVVTPEEVEAFTIEEAHADQLAGPGGSVHHRS